MPNSAILLAGGSGSRMRGKVKDKVLEPLCGLPVILHSFKAFLDSGEISQVVFVCRDDSQQRSIKRLIKKYFPDIEKKLRIDFARGGKERQDSVVNGLKKVRGADSAFAFIHDGARPLVGSENIKKLSAAAREDGAAVLASRVVDTIKRVQKNKTGTRLCKLSDLERNRLWAMQTPQVFRASDILSAYLKVKGEKLSVTDDAAAAAYLKIRPTLVENLSPNPKITVPEDLDYAKFILNKNLKNK